MPKEITHWLVADAVAAALAEQPFWDAIVGAHRDAVRLGAVLPDSPSYVPGRWGADIRRLAVYLHRYDDPYQVVRLALAGVADPPTWQLALLVGVLAHFSADTRFHPLVNSRCGRSMTCHYGFETLIDLALIDDPKQVVAWRLQSMLRRLPVPLDVVHRFVARFFSWQEPVPVREARTMLRWHAWLQACFTRPVCYRVLRTLHTLPGIDCRRELALCYPMPRPRPGTVLAGPLHYRHPVSGRETSVTLAELRDRAVADVVDLLAPVRSAAGLASRLAGRRGASLVSGMPG